LKEIEYVGHLIDAHGPTFSPEKLAHLADVESPVTKGLLKTFLSLANYFRDNVHGYVHIAQPLQKRRFHTQMKIVIIKLYGHRLSERISNC
jgi:hypothetical protein